MVMWPMASFFMGFVTNLYAPSIYSDYLDNGPLFESPLATTLFTLGSYFRLFPAFLSASNRWCWYGFIYCSRLASLYYELSSRRWVVTCGYETFLPFLNPVLVYIGVMYYLPDYAPCSTLNSRLV
jgi:hypothetical protein